MYNPGDNVDTVHVNITRQLLETSTKIGTMTDVTSLQRRNQTTQRQFWRVY